MALHTNYTNYTSQHYMKYYCDYNKAANLHLSLLLLHHLLEVIVWVPHVTWHKVVPFNQ